MLEKYNDVLTVKELSNLLHICEKSVRKLLITGKIPYIAVGRKYLIPKQNIIKFLSETA